MAIAQWRLCAKAQVNKFFQPWVLSLNFLPLTPPLRKPPNRYRAFKKTTHLKKVTSILFISFFLYSCTNRQENEPEFYHVIKHYVKKEHSPPGPPITFYGLFNFILANDSQIFFFRSHPETNCIIVEPQLPPRIYLTPARVEEIEIKDLNDFLTSTIVDSISQSEQFFATISSPTDTIRNIAFKTITDFFKAKHIDACHIRNCTEEEKYVMTSIIRHTTYSPDSIKWTIGFSGEQDDND